MKSRPYPTVIPIQTMVALHNIGKGLLNIYNLRYIILKKYGVLVPVVLLTESLVEFDERFFHLYFEQFLDGIRTFVYTR